MALVVTITSMPQSVMSVFAAEAEYEQADILDEGAADADANNTAGSDSLSEDGNAAGSGSLSEDGNAADSDSASEGGNIAGSGSSSDSGNTTGSSSSSDSGNATDSGFQILEQEIVSESDIPSTVLSDAQSADSEENGTVSDEVVSGEAEEEDESVSDGGTGEEDTSDTGLVTPDGIPVTAITLEKSAVMEDAATGDTLWVAFTAPEAGDYYICAESDSYMSTYAELYDGQWSSLGTQYGGANYEHFGVTWTLEEGETRYLNVGVSYLYEVGDCRIAVRKKEYPVSIDSVKNAPAKTPYGLGFSMYYVSAVLAYEDGSTQTVQMNNYDSYGNLVKYRGINMDSAEFDVNSLDIGSYQFEVYCGTVSATQGFTVVSMADYVQDLEQVTKDTPQTLTGTTQWTLDYAVTAEEAGVYQIQVDGSRWVVSLYDPAAETASPIDYDYSGNVPTYLAPVMDAGEQLLLRLGRYDAAAEAVNVSVTMEQITAPQSMTVTVPEKTVYGDLYEGINVTLSYGEGIEDQTISMEENIAYDSYGNKIWVEFGESESSVGGRPITVSCSGLTQEAVLNVVSRLESGMEFASQITLPESEFCTVDLAQGETGYVKITAASDGDYLITLEDDGSYFYMVDDQENRIYPNYTDNGSVYSLDGSESYLICCLCESDGTARTATVTFVEMKEITAIEVVSAPEYMTGWWDWAYQVQLKVTCGETEQTLNSLYAVLEDGRGMSITVHKAGDDNTYYPYHITNGELGYGEYTVRATCSGKSVDIPVTYASYYDIQMAQAAELLLGTNTLEEAAWDEEFYAYYEAEEAGYYNFTITGGWSNVYAEEGSWPGLPESIYLSDGGRVLLQVYKNSNSASWGETFSLTVTKAPEIASILLEVPEGPFYGNNCLDGIKVTYQYKDTSLADESGYLWDIIGSYNYSNKVILTKDGVSTVREDGYSIDPGTYTLTVQAGGASSEEISVTVADEWDMMPELTLSETDEEGNLIPTSLELEEGVWTYYQFCTGSEGGYCFDVQNASCELFSEDNEYLGYFREGTNSRILDANARYKLGFCPYGGTAQPTVTISQTSVNTLVSVSLLRTEFWEQIDELRGGDIEVTYQTSDGTPKTLQGDNYDENGFKAEYEVFTTEGESVSSYTAGESYICHVEYAGSETDLAFTAKSLTEAVFDTLEADKTYSVPSNTNQIYTFSASEAQRYQLYGNVTVKIFDAGTLECILDTGYDSNLFDAEKGKIYYIRLENHYLNEDTEFTMESGKVASSIEILEQQAAEIPAGVPYFPMAAMKAQITYEDGEVSVLSSSGTYLHDNYGNYMSATVTDEAGNLYDYENGLAVGTYTVTLDFADAVYAYTLTVKSRTDLSLEQLTTGEYTLSGNGVFYYEFVPSKENYLSSMNLYANQRLYDTAAGKLLDKDYSGDKSQWTSLTPDNTYYAVIWFDPENLSDTDTVTWTFSELKTITELEILDYQEEFLFGEAGYLEDLKVKVTYDDGTSKEWMPEYEGSWRDDQGYYLDCSVKNSKGSEINRYYVLPSGTYTVTLQMGDAEAKSCSFTVKANETVLLKEGSQEVSLEPQTSQVYQIPKGSNDRVWIHVDGNVDYGFYTSEREDGNNSGLSWSGGSSSDHVDIWLHNALETGDLYLKLTNLEGASQEETDGIEEAETNSEENAEVLTITIVLPEDQSAELIESTLPVDLEPLGWREAYEILEDIRAVITYGSETATENLYTSMDVNGYYYEIQCQDPSSGEYIYYDEIQEGQTCQVVVYQCWGGSQEETVYTGEVTFVSEEKAAVEVDQSQGVVSCETAAGKWYLYSFTPEITNSYVLSFDMPVDLRWITREGEYSWVSADTGNEFSFELTEGEPFYFRFRTEDGLQQSFTILEADKAMFCSVEGSYTYTGSAIEPEVTVVNGYDSVIDSSYYTVEYEENINAGTAKVTVKGIGSYAGLSDTAYFQILPRDISDFSLNAEEISFIFNGSSQVPSFTVTDGTGLELVSGQDYSFYVTDQEDGSLDSTSAGNKNIWITGKGNYTGSLSLEYAIAAKNIEQVQITPEEIPAQAYQSGGCRPQLELYDEETGKTLTEGADYTLTYENETQPGNASVTVTAQGNYSGTITKSYVITSADLSKAVVAEIPQQTENGLELEPAVSVSLDGITLTAGEDYDAVYENNVDPGTATVTITGKNGYAGECQAEFTIVSGTIWANSLQAEDLSENSVQKPDAGHSVVWYRWSPDADGFYLYREAGSDSDSVRLYKMNEDGSLAKVDDDLRFLDEENKVALGSSQEDEVYYIQMLSEGEEILIWRPAGISAGASVEQGTVSGYAAWSFAPQENGTYQMTLENSGTIRIFAENLAQYAELTLEQEEADYSASASFVQGVKYLILYPGEIESCVLTLTKVEDVIPELTDDNNGVNAVHIPGGSTVTFQLPAEEGRRYVSCEQSTMNFTIGTVEDPQQYQQTGYGIGYVGSSEETLYVTVTNLSELGVTELIIGAVPEVSASLETSRVPQQADLEWMDAVPGLVQVEVIYGQTDSDSGDAADSGESEEPVIWTADGQKDKYGYSWSVVKEEAEGSEESGDLEETGSVSFLLQQQWLDETPDTIGSFEVEQVAAEGLTGLRRSWGSGFDSQDVLTGEARIYTFVPVYTGSYVLTLEDGAWVSADPGTAPVYVREQEIVATAGTPCSVLIVPAEGSSEQQYRLRRNTETSGWMQLEFESGEIPVFTGLPIIKEYYVIDTESKYVLKEGVDYTASVTSNINAGVVTINLTGLGEYSPLTAGMVSGAFLIQQADISSVIFPELPEYSYTGEAISYAETAKMDSGYTLKAGTDYEVVESITEVGSHTVTLQGKGNFTGTKEVSFKIVPKDISGASVTVNGTYTYTGSEILPEVTVTLDGRTLDAEDYTVSGSNNINAGTGAVLTISGTGNYTGTCSAEFEILPRSVKELEILPIAEQVYDRREKEPKPVVKDGEKILTEGEDYAVTYKDNVNLGTGTAVITGCGNYKDEAEVSFDIVHGTTAYVTAVASENTMPDAYDRFDQNFLEGLILTVSYTDGSEQMLAAGAQDSFGRIFTAQIVDGDGNLFEEGSVLEPGTYWRQITVTYPETEELEAETYRLETEFTVWNLAQSYEENEVKAGDTTAVPAEETEGALELVRFTAERSWKYVISSESELTLWQYDENGRTGTALTGTSVELELEAGTYFYELTAEEETSAVFAEKAAPDPVDTLVAYGDVKCIKVSWNMASKIDAGYKLYRKAEGEEEFTLLKSFSDRSVTSYTDYDVAEETIYIYKIVVTDGNYVVSEDSLEASAQTLVDTEAPLVTSITPANGTRINGTVTITMTAQDNVAVSRSVLEVKNAEGTWEELASSESESCSYDLDTTAYEDGILEIRAVAYDPLENTSAGLQYKYEIDNSGPGKVMNVSEKAHTSVTITLQWDDVADEDISFYRVEEKLADGTWQKVGDTSSTLGMNIKDLTPDCSYTYQVIGYDILGNRGEPSDEITVTTSVDTTSPVNSGITPVGGYFQNEIPMTFSGSDEYGIASLDVQVKISDGEWTTLETFTYDGSQMRLTQEYTVNASALPEGTVRVRGIFTDVAGNVSDMSNQSPFVELVIDRTAPAKPQLDQVIGRNGYVELIWSQGSEEDLNGYNVYRCDTQDGTYVKLASNLTCLNYADTTAQAGQYLYYKITASDLAGNESEFSDINGSQAEEIPGVEAAEDTQKPKIRGVYPTTGSLIGSGSRTVTVGISDNSCLEQFTAVYKVNDGAYQDLYSTAVTGTEASLQFQIPTTDLVHGDEVSVQVQAQDAVGNASTAVTVKYQVDLEAPSASEVVASYLSDDKAVEITWQGGAEEDAAGYRIYRAQEGTDSWKFIGQLAVTEETSYAYTDWSLDLSAISYTYKIEAVDILGNTSETCSEVIDLPDRSMPVARIDCESVMEMQVEYRISAANSSDNTGIVSYEMDMGDETVYRSSEVIHKYENPGTYTITLTVTDTDGNTGTLRKQVEVKERTLLGTVKVLVQGTDGLPIAGAPVYFDLGEEEQFIRTTDGTGWAEFTAETGSHTVGCVIGNNEYLPQKKEVVVSANAVSSLTFTMVKQPIIEGSFEIERMTFDEIVAAGIDIDDPENQYIVKITAKIRYGMKEYDLDFLYNFLNGFSNLKPIRIELDSGDRWVFPNIIIPDPVPDPSINPDPNPDPYPDVPNPENMGLGLLEVPVGVSALKEFFDVKLHILNNSSSEFSMLDNQVALNLPGGLSIVDTEGTEESAIVEIPEIQGGTQTTVNWILRGDQVGSYLLSADYSGILSDFNAPMTAKFEAEEPIEVYGLSGMKLTMHVAKELKDETLYFDLDLENQGEIDVYMPSLSSDEDSVLVYQEYFAGDEQVLIPDTTVMKPGEKLVHHYKRPAEVQYDSFKYLKEYWTEVGENYGLEIEIVEEELSYFRAADDKVTLTFNSMGGSRVASIEGLPKGSTFEQLQSSLIYSYLKWPVPVKDGLYFNGWYKTADCSGDPFDKQTVIDSSITLYAKWGKESTELGSLTAKVGKGQYGIHFVNSKGIPLEDVEVTLNGTTKYTDADGDVVFWKPLSDKASLTADAVGYCKHEEEEYELEENCHDMIILYTSQEKKFFMKKALYHLEDSEDTMNIMKEKLRLTILRDPDTDKILEDQNPPFAIDCYIKADSGGDFYRMELWQKDNLLQTVEEIDENGCVSFTGLDLNLFEYTNDVFVKTYFKDGTSEGMVKTDLNVDICDLKDFEVCFGDGDGFKFQIPSGVPLLGGIDMEIEFPTWPTYYHVTSNGTIEAGINVTDTFMASEEQRETLKKFLDDTKEAYSTGKGLITGDKELKKKLMFMSKDVSSWDDTEFKVDGIGYASGQLTRENGLAKLSGNFVIIIEVKWGFNVFHMIAGVVPVSFEVDFGGEVQAGFEFGYSFKEDKWNLGSDLSLEPFIELFAGLGVHDVLAAGGYGRGEGDVEFEATNGLVLDKLEATYSIGLKAYAGPFEFKYEILKPDSPFVLYNRGSTASVASVLYAAEYVSEEVTYNFVEREYLDTQSDWMGENVSSEAGERSELLTDTYGASDPQIVTAGDTTVMVYIGDTQESGRTAANMGQLMYSVYKDGAWQSPKPVDHNDYADVNFSLYADGETIYLAYQEADQIFADTINTTPVDYFNSLDIVTVVFDADAEAFGEPQKITDTDSRYDSMPDTVVHDGKQITVWVSNENGDLFTANSTNEIRMRTLENGTASDTVVLKSGVQRVMDLEAGVLEGAFAAAYVEEGDTTTLNLLFADGSSRRIAEGELAQPQFVTLPGESAECLVWYQDGNLMKLTSASGSAEVLIDGSVITVRDAYRIVEDYILYIGTDENGQSSVYASVYRDGSWKEPVVVTSQTDSIYQINAAMVDGQIGLVMMQSSVSQTGEETQDHYSMSYLILADTHNLQLTAAEYDDELAVPGEILPVTFIVENKGTAEVTSIEAKITDAEGSVINQKTFEQTIMTAETASFVLDMQVPEELDETLYTLSAWEGGTSEQEANEMTFSLYRTDLSLNAEVNQVGKNYEIAAEVENLGYITSGGAIRVYAEYNDELLYETDVESLAPGESEVYMLRLDTTKLSVAEDAITIELDTDIEDYDSFNNTCIEMIYQRHEITYYVNGSLWSSECLEDGSVLVLPQEPSGATQFLGWYRIDTGEAVTENMSVTESMELEAKFAEALYCIVSADGTVTMTDDWNSVVTALQSEEAVTVELLHLENSEVTVIEMTDKLTVKNGNILVVSQGITLKIAEAGELVNNGDLKIEGTLAVAGALTNTEEMLVNGTLEQAGTFQNSGTMNNNGTVVNTGTVANTGTIYNSLSFNTAEGSVTGSGSFINSGTVTGEENVEAVISSHVHVFASSYTTDREATCYQEGIQSLHCTVDGCQARTGLAAVAATEHSYGEWEVRVVPTLTAEGNQVRICQVCSHTDTEEIPNLTDVPYEMEDLLVSGWKGAYDGMAHGPELTGAPEGALVSWFEKEDAAALTEAPTYVAEGFYTVWYRIEKSGYETAEGSVAIEITQCSHIFSGEWIIDQEAGENTVGYKSHHCTVTGCTARTNVTVIPATGSKYSDMQTALDAITEESAADNKEVLQGYVDTVLEEGAGDASLVAEQVDMDTLAKLDVLYTASVETETADTQSVVRESTGSMLDAAGNELTSAQVTVEGAAITAAAVAKELDAAGEEPQTLQAQLTVQTLSEEDVLDEELKARMDAGTAMVFDINLSVVNAETKEVVTDTETIQPKSPIRITISIPVELRYSENLILIHQKSDGTEEELSYTRDDTDQTITFVATSLSWHILSACECKEHQYTVQTGYLEPTCAEDGWIMQKCRFCTEVSTEVIPATGEHTGGTATCQKKAVCTLCQKEYGSLGSHDYSSAWTTDTKATCEKAGSRSHHCTTTGCTSKAGTEAIPALGHTGGTATCQEKAVCTRCGKAYGSLGDHQFSTAWTIDKEATCLSAGSKSHHCTVSGCTAKTGTKTIQKLKGTINLTTKNLPLQVKKSVQLRNIVTGTQAGDYIVSCTSDNAAVASVSNVDKITGKKAGTAVITIRMASGAKAAVTIKVQKAAVQTTAIGLNVKKTLSLQKGEKVKVTATISPITSLYKATYTSSNKKVATVSKTGLITAKASGKAKITVKSGKKKAVITVNVAKTLPTKINGVLPAKTLKVKKSFTLTPKLYPAGSEAKITYTSSNKKVATVSAKGKVTAKKAGTAVITVKAGTLKAKCVVTVE